MERIREMQKMDILVNVKACQEHFRFIQIMKELYERDGFDPRFLLLNLLALLVQKYKY
jgi:hypothetical protein